MKGNLFLAFIICSSPLFSQTAKYPVISIPVERNGITLSNPWAGGMNAPQFSSIDLNNDGLDDLFVFDRGGDRVLTFTNDGSHSDTAFHYAPQYEKLFPPMTQWAVIRDYNSDNIPDIFTYQPGETTPQGQQIPAGGIKVFKGSRISGVLHFEVNQYTLSYSTDTAALDLWTNSIGIPPIADVNRDGDLDVLTFNVYGTQVEYYENQTKEQGRPADSLFFNRVTSCWGHFYHGTGNNLTVWLNIGCNDSSLAPVGGNSRHASGAISALDYGNDHDIDLLVSGTNFNYMVLLNNSADSSHAFIGWQDTLFSSCGTPLHLPNFPNAFEIDADNDGLKDLLFAPNYSNSALDTRNVTLYKNTPGDTCTYRSMNTDSFLVHTLLDFGTDSKGVFFDYNGDGLMDIVVGNYYLYNPTVAAVSNVALYENTGTNSQPSFRQVTNDYSNLSSFNLLAINPCFGDLDGDGKKDMLIGDKNGNIHFFKNTGGTVASFPAMTTPDYFNIDVGTYAAPFIYDINGDSLPDLVIGEQNGRLNYYWNFGTSTNPQFSPDSANTFFGSIRVNPPASADGFSQPFIMKDSAGNMLLFVGSQTGLISEYLIDPAKLDSGAFALLNPNVMNYDAGMNATMQAYDLNNDGKLEYLLGNSLGGLQIFSESIWDSSTVISVNEPSSPLTVSVFPNPADNYFTCISEKRNFQFAQIEIFSAEGRKLQLPVTGNYGRITVDCSSLAGGIYFIRITSGEDNYLKKILILH